MGQRMLIVEDDPTFRKVLTLLFDDQWTVDAAGDGETALALAAAQPPDVALVDFQLPGIDGLETARQLRARPQCRQMPVVMLSGVAAEPVRVRAFSEGVRDFLIKPVTEAELKARVAALMRAAEEHRREMEEAQRHRREAEEECARLLREAEEASRAKDQFMALLSHELRTPLNAIIGWAHLLRGDGLDAAMTRHALQVIERNGTMLARLVSDVLDLSAIQAGRLVLEREALDLAEPVGEAVEGVRAAAAAKGVTVVAELQAGAVVDGDRARLQQAVGHLLDNAVKFTGAGGRVEVHLGAIDAEAVVTVADTGIGFPPEFQARLFRPFEQADSTSTRAHGGLGIGLALAQRLVALHGGRVSGASERSRGTTMVVRLPLRAGRA